MYEEAESLIKYIAELDIKLKAAREKIRRDRITHRSLRYERQRAAKQLKRLNYVTGIKRAGMHDSTFVRNLEVANQIAFWVEYEEGNYRKLSDLCGVSVRTISRIVSQQVEWSTYDTADRLLTAMGVQYVLNELETKPNERYRPPKPPQTTFYED